MSLQPSRPSDISSEAGLRRSSRKGGAHGTSLRVQGTGGKLRSEELVQVEYGQIEAVKRVFPAIKELDAIYHLARNQNNAGSAIDAICRQISNGKLSYLNEDDNDAAAVDNDDVAMEDALEDTPEDDVEID